MKQKIKDILAQTVHRPWPMALRPWIWYQEWNDLIFMHARVDINWLKQQLPDELAIDTFEGAAWVSIVVFRMQQIRPRYLPAVGSVSNFDEINIRVYVRRDDMPGVFFLSIEGNNRLSCQLAKTISGLPYRYIPFTYSGQSLNTPYLSFDYKTGADIVAKSLFEKWITERYCLYNSNGPALQRYHIHHLSWPLQQIEIGNLQQRYPLLKTIDGLFVPESFQYSPGVQVMAWPVERL